jgi:hypothetical protein
LFEVPQIQPQEAELLKIKSARALMSISQNPVEECEGGGSLLILTSGAGIVNKQRGDVVFPLAVVSMELEELGKGIPLTEPTEAGLLSSNRTMERSESKIAEFEETPHEGSDGD